MIKLTFCVSSVRSAVNKCLSRLIHSRLHTIQLKLKREKTSYKILVTFKNVAIPKCCITTLINHLEEEKKINYLIDKSQNF